EVAEDDFRVGVRRAGKAGGAGGFGLGGGFRLGPLDDAGVLHRVGWRRRGRVGGRPVGGAGEGLDAAGGARVELSPKLVRDVARFATGWTALGYGRTRPFVLGRLTGARSHSPLRQNIVAKRGAPTTTLRHEPRRVNPGRPPPNRGAATDVG